MLQPTSWAHRGRAFTTYYTLHLPVGSTYSPCLCISMLLHCHGLGQYIQGPSTTLLPWQALTRGRAGSLRVQTQGALPQQNCLPALFPLVAIFSKT